MSFSVYILFSEKLNRFYVGCTQDLDSRLKEHFWKHKGFTAKASDWEVRYTEEFPTKQLALQREKQIKGWKSKKMIERLIND